MPRLTVKLPVCPVPECRHVGKLPGSKSTTFICNGGKDQIHRRTKMELREFVEVRRG